MTRPFPDRAEAGQVLAEKLAAYAGRDDVIVLALPRGGVPVAYEVASALGVPLDVFLVRKLGAPGHEELAMGAIASGDVVVMNDEVVKVDEGLRPTTSSTTIASERRELARREAAYRDDRPPVEVQGRTVILIDDGLATGSTMRAAVTALRRQDPARIVVAVPIGASSTCAEFQDDRRRGHLRRHPGAVPGRRDVVRGLHPDRATTRSATCLARRRHDGDPMPRRRSRPPGDHHERYPSNRTSIEQRGDDLRGGRDHPRNLEAAPGGSAVVVFAHGSGSGRFSPRNQYVAQVLGGGRPRAPSCSTCWRTPRPTTAPRSSTSSCWPIGLQAAADWLAASPRPQGLRLGYFGASTGAGAALLAAARAPDSVGAVVSRGGRPDLAGDALPRVTAPTLLIVGGSDEIVLELNREAFDQLNCARQLDIVPGATHLFPEPGALEEVARLAREWFLHYLTPSAH